MRQPEGAEKQAPPSPCTPGSQTSISRRSDKLMTDKMKCLPTAMAASWPSTPRWFAPLTSTGQPQRRGGGQFAAAALQDARKAKERAYPEFRTASRCRLIVLAIEDGVRWHTYSPPEPSRQPPPQPSTHMQPRTLLLPHWSLSLVMVLLKRTTCP